MTNDVETPHTQTAPYVESTDKYVPRTRVSNVLIRRSSSLFFRRLIALDGRQLAFE